MNSCSSLNAEIGDVIRSPYRYPQNERQMAIGALKTAAYTSLGCMLVMGTVSLLEGSGVWERLRFTLIAGGAWTVPMGGTAVFIYCKCATPPEKSQKVLAKAIGIKASDVDAHEWESSLNKEIAKKAVAVADGLRPIEMLDEWVRPHISLKERIVAMWKPACIGGAGLGLFVGSVLLSAGAVDGLLFDPSFLRAVGLVTVAIPLPVSFAVMVKLLDSSSTPPLERMPRTKYLVGLARAKGDVRGQFTTFYADRGESPAKAEVAGLLGVTNV